MFLDPHNYMYIHVHDQHTSKSVPEFLPTTDASQVAHKCCIDWHWQWYLVPAQVYNPTCHMTQSHCLSHARLLPDLHSCMYAQTCKCKLHSSIPYYVLAIYNVQHATSHVSDPWVDNNNNMTCPVDLVMGIIELYYPRRL